MKPFIFISSVILLGALVVVTVCDFIQWYSAMGVK
jgi:hypothetical protein